MEQEMNESTARAVLTQLIETNSKLSETNERLATVEEQLKHVPTPKKVAEIAGEVVAGQSKICAAKTGRTLWSDLTKTQKGTIISALLVAIPLLIDKLTQLI